MIYYKSMKDFIYILDLMKIIIDYVIRYYNFLDLIVIDKGSSFISKFLLLLCYFLVIK